MRQAIGSGSAPAEYFRTARHPAWVVPGSFPAGGVQHWRLVAGPDSIPLSGD